MPHVRATFPRRTFDCAVRLRAARPPEQCRGSWRPVKDAFGAAAAVSCAHPGKPATPLSLFLIRVGQLEERIRPRRQAPVEGRPEAGQFRDRLPPVDLRPHSPHGLPAELPYAICRVQHREEGRTVPCNHSKE